MVIEATYNGFRKQLEADELGYLKTRSVASTRAQEAAISGDAYNFNTGKIGLTSSTESAVFYYKHDLTRPMIVDAFVVSVDDSGTRSGSTTTVMEIFQDPTAGTIVSGATAVDIVVNRNGSFPINLGNYLAYKGAEGNTFTNGTSWAIIDLHGVTRQSIPIDMVINRGGSVGITLDTQTTSGTTNIYVSMICHVAVGN